MCRSHGITVKPLTNLIADFILECRAAGRSSKTISFYQANLTAWSDFIGDRDWRDPRLSVAFIAELQARDCKYIHHTRREPAQGHLSNETIRGYVRSMRRFGNWLIECEIAFVNPFAKVPMPKKSKHLPKAMAKDDFDKIIAAATTLRDKAILYTMRDTGCRAGEVCRMTLDRCYLDKGYILVTGKGDKDRFVFVGEIAVNALRAYITSERPQGRGDYLFFRRFGEPLQVSTLDQLLRRLAKRAGVTHQHNPHSIRHALGRDFIMDGGDVATLKDILGHEQIETTDIYTKFSLAELQAKHRAHSPLK